MARAIPAHLSQDLSGAQAHRPQRKTRVGVVGRDEMSSGKWKEHRSREFSSSSPCNSLEKKGVKGKFTYFTEEEIEAQNSHRAHRSRE